jgi:chromate transporter
MNFRFCTRFFFTVLGMNAISWSGLALIAQLERYYVRRKGLVSAEAFGDLVSVAWMVPGPVGYTLSVQLGYTLAGAVGAVAAALGCVFPFLAMMTGLAFAYSHHLVSALSTPRLVDRFIIILIALIGSALIGQVRKEVKSRAATLGAIGATMALCMAPGPVTFIAVLGGAFAFGWWHASSSLPAQPWPSMPGPEKTIFALLALLVVVYVALPAGTCTLVDALRYAGAGLTLFGGGFSALPVMHTLYLTGARALPPEVFRAALSLSSFSPGPLLNIAPFLGYERQGVAGSLIDTAMLFMPCGLLAVLVLRWRTVLSQSTRFEQALTLLRAITTSFLACTLVQLVPQITPSPSNLFIGAICVVFLWTDRLPVYVLYAGVGLSTLIF